MVNLPHPFHPSHVTPSKDDEGKSTAPAIAPAAVAPATAEKQQSTPATSSVSQSEDHSNSLHTLLPTPAQRSDLTLLLATITTQMRINLTSVFDPRFSLPADGGDGWAAPPKDPLADPKLDLSKVDVVKLDKQRKQRERVIKELSEPALQTLKKSALEFFDKWRDGVLGRVGEVLNSKSEAKEQAKEAEGTVQPQPPPKSRRLEETSLKLVKQQHEGVTTTMNELYPAVETPLLKELDEEQRRLILHSIMLLLLSLEHYYSYSRVLLLYLTSSLELSLDFLAEDEANVARTLLQAAELSADAETKKKAEEGASGRKWKVGIATVAGAALIGVTGGLATPLIAAGIGTMMGGLGLEATVVAGYLGALASSEMVIGGLFGAYGGSMTGKVMDEYAKQVEDFAFVPVHQFSKPRKIEREYRRLRVGIAISGWLTDKHEIVKPWRVLDSTIEGFALRWELEALLRLGNALSGMLRSTAWAYAKKEIIARTVAAALFEALWPLSLLRVARVVDNPFSVAQSRARKAGRVLADALANKAQGERPVTLIGYSLGAAVIYTCLMSLAERGAFGLVESVVLIGAPAPSDPSDWRKMRAVVAARLVNVYSENDYILAFLYRTSSIQYGVAGLQPIEYVKGVENVDVSDIVSGHLRYRYLSGSILKRIGFEDLDVDLVEEEEEELRAVEESEEKERAEKEKKITKKDGKPGQGENADELEQEVEKKNKESMLDWAKSKLPIRSMWASKDDGKEKT